MSLFELDGKRPQLPADGSVWIAPGAQVIGDVILEQGVSIWFNAVLRGDNEPIRIGRGSNIQDGVVVHTDPGFPVTIAADCTVGHNAIIHGCSLGEGALIGMGATVLNGAVIGSGALVGANALVTEGKEFDPGALIVGAPAKAVRALDAEAQAGLRATAGRYQSNWKRYRTGLIALD